MPQIMTAKECLLRNAKSPHAKEMAVHILYIGKHFERYLESLYVPIDDLATFTFKHPDDCNKIHHLEV